MPDEMTAGETHGETLWQNPEPTMMPAPGPDPTLEPLNPSDTQMKHTRTAPQVTLIGAAAFALVCNQPGTELAFLSISKLQNVELSAQDVDTATKEADVDLSSIPPEYQEFANLFHKEEADKLPPHQPYNHTIPLEQGKTPPFGPIYKCSPGELDAIRKYIHENMQKGFICHSQSPCGAPIVFAQKKDGLRQLPWPQ